MTLVLLCTIIGLKTKQKFKSTARVRCSPVRSEVVAKRIANQVGVW